MSIKLSKKWVREIVHIKKLILLLTLCFILPTNAYCVSVPTNTDAGVIDKSIQKDLLEQRIEKQLLNIDEKAPVNREAVKKPIEKDMGEYIYNPKFKLNEIIFVGNSLYNTQELQKLSEPLLGKDIIMDDLVDLTVKISRYYQGKGFLTCYAYIPEQEVENGVVKIAISESTIESISIQGNKWTKEKYLKSFLTMNKLQEGDVFNANKLQTALKDLNQNDYLKGQVSISKDQNTDKTAIVLDVQDRLPVGFDINWDNYGRRLIGEQRANMILSYDNLTGHGDKLYGGTILARGTKGAMAGYQIPLNDKGTKLSFDYSFSTIKLGREYTSDDIHGKSKDYALTLTHPLYRTNRTSLLASAAFDMLSSSTKWRSTDYTSSNYSLRVFRTGLYGMHDDNYGRWVGYMGADFGANFLGASPSIANGSSSSFIKYKAGITRVHRLPHRSLGIIRLDGQYSPDKMFPAEQMQIGGPFSVRGYEPGVILGDYGASGSFEVRTPIPYLNAFLPKKLEKWEDKIKFVTFYDWGYVKEHGNLYGYPLNFLQSVGAGLHMYLTDYLSASCSVGIPVGQKNYQGADARFIFAVNSEVDKFFFKPKERL